MKHIPGDGVAFAAECSHRWPGLTFSNGKVPYLISRVHQATPGNYQAYLDAQWNENATPLNLKVNYSDLSTLKALKHKLSADFSGALGFTKDDALLITAIVQAESGKAMGNASVNFGEDEKLKLEANYELEMQEKHSFRLSTQLWNRKKYEVTAAIVNTDLEKSLSLDVIMSKHIALDIKVKEIVEILCITHFKSDQQIYLCYYYLLFFLNTEYNNISIRVLRNTS